MKKNTLYAFSVLVGTIIGAGIFGLPYILAKAGILIGFFYFLFLGLIILLMHLFYGEVILRTQATHRIVGYAQIYLGDWGKRILLFSALVSLLGSNLVYLILGSGFLKTIFGGQSLIFYVAIFWFLLSLGIIFDWKRMAFFEFFMTALLILAAVLIAFYGFSHFKAQNLTILNFKYFFLPWGIIFYALSGGSAIPELREILGGETKKLKKIVVAGTFFSILIYIIFVLAVVGATGSATSQEAISGLKNMFGDGVIYLGAAFGVLTVATSYLVFGIVLKKILIQDLRANKFVATSSICLAPIILYIIGFHNFLVIISFLGLWLGAIDGILMLLIHRRAKIFGDRQPEYSLNIPKFGYWLIGLIFIIGLISNLIFRNY